MPPANPGRFIPFMKWSENGLWVTGLDGTSFSFSQSSLSNVVVTSDGYKTVYLTNHEGSDCQIKVKLKIHEHDKKFLWWKTGTYYTYTYHSANLLMKDGRQIDFDGKGRVAQYSDASHSNWITFAYDDNKAESVTDSRGRMLRFDYGDGVTIKNVAVTNDEAELTSKLNVRYEYDVVKNTLTATDIGGRKWTYGYESKNLNSATQIKTGGYQDPYPTSTKVWVLKTVSGPGIGISTVTTNIVTQSANLTQDGISFRLIKDRLVAGKLETSIDGTSTLRTTSYDYTFATSDQGQHYVTNSTVEDGRTKRENTYLAITKTRRSLSNAPESLIDGLGFDTGERPDNDEVVTVLDTSTLSSLSSGTVLDTLKQTWVAETMRLESSKTFRDENKSYQRVGYKYDNWGNPTSITATSKVNDERLITKTDLFSYYNTDSASLNLGTDVGLGDEYSYLKYFQRNLITEHKQISSGLDEDNVEVSTSIASAYIYNDDGQVIEQKRWTGTVWTSTTYAYDSDTGELSKAIGPTQTTEYDYGDILQGTIKTGYQITATQKSVALGSSTKDLVTINKYRYIDGANIATTDARKLTTSRVFDDLGRITSLVEPADANGLTPTTLVVYDDTNLTSTVTNPLDLETKYSFDKLGRLSKITKKDKSTSEEITSVFGYDAWDNTVTVKGPVSNKERNPERTLENVVTTFTYDARGRITSVLVPGSSIHKTNTYDDSINQVVTVDEMGNISSRILDWAGRPIIQKVHIDGADLTSQTYYDGIGRVIASVDPNGNATSYSYNSFGLNQSVVGQARTVFENGVSVPNVSPETIRKYNKAGYLEEVSQRVAGGRAKTSTYALNGLGMILSASTPVTVTNPDGSSSVKTLVTSYTYDENGNKQSETTGYAGEKTVTKRWNYDSHNRVVTEVDELNRSVGYTYDAVGNLKSVTDPRNNLYPGKFELSLDYNGFSRLIQATLPSSENPAPVIDFAYDGAGNLVARAEVGGPSIQYEYSLRNKLVSENLQKADASGYIKVTHGYDAAGRETSVTSPSGHTVYTEYDGASRVVRTGNNIAGWTAYTYYPNGSIATVTDGKGNTTKVASYTPENQPLEVIDAKNNSSYSRYDRVGLLTQSKDAEGNLRTYTYDELGRLVSEKTPWGISIQGTTWDARGNATHQWDANGTRFEREFLDTNLLSVETAYGASSTQTRSFLYDEAGALRSATDNGVTTAYNTVDGVYKPDPYGLIRKKTNTFGGQSLSMAYEYDSHQRLTKVEYPDSTSASYQYNNLDQVTGLSGWISGSVSYDEYGRFTGYTASNGVTKSVVYDNQDRLSELNYATNGATLENYSLTYDLAGNIATKNQNAYGYDVLNQLVAAYEKGWFQKSPEQVAKLADYGVAARDYKGNVVLDFSVEPTKLDTASQSVGLDLHEVMGVNKIQITPQNADHRVTVKELSVWAGTNNYDDYVKITDWTWNVEADGSITLLFPKIFTARYVKINTTWDDRDVDNRSIDTYATFSNSKKDLVKVWALKSSQLSQFAYDKQGNRTSLSIDSESVGYTYYKNQAGGNLPWIAYDSTWYYQYDRNGNLVAKAKKATIDVNQATNSDAFTIDTSEEYWTYQWDLRNRLSSVAHNGAQLVSYVYDAENLRVSRVGGDGTTVYAHGRNGAIGYQKKIASGEARTYVYLNDTTVGWIDTASDGAQTKYYAITDHLGSVTAVTDSAAKVVWSSEYEPFGKVAGVEGLYDFDGSYAGHQVDTETGLIYMWNRWQDPSTGRFISEDPVRDGLNWYAYVGNRPFNATDPTGLSGSFPDTAEETEEWIEAQNRKSPPSEGDSKDNGGEATKEPEYFVYQVRVAGHIIDTQRVVKRNNTEEAKESAKTPADQTKPVADPYPPDVAAVDKAQASANSNNRTDLSGVMDCGISNRDGSTSEKVMRENSAAQREALRSNISTFAGIAGPPLDVAQNATSFGTAEVISGRNLMSIGNGLLQGGFVNIDKDATIRTAESAIAKGGSNVRSGVRKIAVGKFATYVGAVLSVAPIGASLATGDKRSAIKNAWAFNLGVPGGVMSGAIAGFFVSGPLGSIIGAGVGGVYFSMKGEEFGEIYYDTFIEK
jgi:RHS repeat-associated protein